MKNFFKSDTVDSIVSGMVRTLNRLDALRESKIVDAEIAQRLIDSATELRDENLAEAERAKKIAANVKKLLDIS